MVACCRHHRLLSSFPRTPLIKRRMHEEHHVNGYGALPGAVCVVF